jgi:hypothetical protein
MSHNGSTRTRRLSTVAALCVASTVFLTGYADASVSTTAAPTAAASGDSSWSKTQVMSRTTTDADGKTVVDTRTVTVNADRTADLQGRQSVQLTWSGAHPTSGLAPDPYDATKALIQEYPVVVLECRGTGGAAGAALPADQQPRPESCWTTTQAGRGASGDRVVRRDGVLRDDAVWTHDASASAAERADSWPSAAEFPTEWCGSAGTEATAVHRVPFVAVSGTTFWACDGRSFAPEMNGSDNGGALPANDLAAATRADGTGAMPFEIRTFAENQSLGCSDSVPCSIVVIPIIGISCLTTPAATPTPTAMPTPTDTAMPTPAATAAPAGSDAVCNLGANYAAGEKLDGQKGTSAAVQGLFWWSASNWQNRFVIPITIAPSTNVCDVLDSRSPESFYGSPILALATLQWAPAFCLSEDRFRFQGHSMPEATAFSNLRRGKTTAAFMTYAVTPQRSDPPVAYAPVAVTAFAVAFTIDGPDGSQLKQLRLSPRLIAKLLTGSYLGVPSSVGLDKDRPELAKNPRSLQLDPEFLQLNPELRSDNWSWVIADMSWASLISLSVPSDIVRSLTAYLAADPETAAFLHGAPDPWGMTVNSAYIDISLPRDDWPLLDTWEASKNACDVKQPLAWFNRVLAPISDLSRIAQDVLSATPESLGDHISVSATDPSCVFKRTARQPYGRRHVLGLVSLADASAYGLTTASLRTSGTGPDAIFVSPNDQSMAAAIGAAAQSAPGQPFLIDPVALRSRAEAYPGTMAVNAVAPLSGLDATTAGHIAQFIRVATNDGQVAGSGFGQLAAGYLPLTSTGPAAPLYASAQVVGEAIRVQSGRLPGAAPTPTASASTTSKTSSSAGSASASVTATTTGAPASGAVPPATATVVGAPAPAASSPPMALARAVTVAPALTGIGAASLPTAMGIGALGLMSAPVLRRLSARRPRP